MVASPEHPKLNVEEEKKKCLKRCGLMPYSPIWTDPIALPCSLARAGNNKGLQTTIGYIIAIIQLKLTVSVLAPHKLHRRGGDI